jgi:hypothetical protein
MHNTQQLQHARDDLRRLARVINHAADELHFASLSSLTIDRNPNDDNLRDDQRRSIDLHVATARGVIVTQPRLYAEALFTLLSKHGL